MNKNAKTENTLLVAVIAVSSICSFAHGATIPDFHDSGITAVEIDWDSSASPSGNTTLTGGGGPFALPENSSSFSNNVLWNHRSNAAAWDFPGLTDGVGGFGHVGHGWHTTPDSLLKITTTVSGLALGTYDLYAFYIYGTTDDEGGAAAAVGGGSLMDLDQDTIGAINLGDTSGNLAGDWRMYAYQLGTATDVTSFSIDWGGGTTRRNMPVAVGYVLVPEPATIALMGITGLMLIRRRRKN